MPMLDAFLMRDALGDIIALLCPHEPGEPITHTKIGTNPVPVLVDASRQIAVTPVYIVRR
jgi:hypothetical protein